MTRANEYIKMLRAVMPAPEKKKYVTDPPKTHIYDRTLYHYEKTIKPNMHMYRSEYGYRTCFDNFELKIKG